MRRMSATCPSVSRWPLVRCDRVVACRGDFRELRGARREPEGRGGGVRELTGVNRGPAPLAARPIRRRLTSDPRKEGLPRRARGVVRHRRGAERDMIQTGERAPDFVLPSPGGPTRFYGIAGGRPVALVFCGPESLDLVARYADRAGPDAAVVAVTSGGGDGERAFPVLVDGEGAVQAMFLGEGDESARLVLLDPNLRVLGKRVLLDCHIGRVPAQVAAGQECLRLERRLARG